MSALADLADDELLAAAGSGASLEAVEPCGDDAVTRAVAFARAWAALQRGETAPGDPYPLQHPWNVPRLAGRLRWRHEYGWRRDGQPDGEPLPVRPPVDDNGPATCPCCGGRDLRPVPDGRGRVCRPCNGGRPGWRTR